MTDLILDLSGIDKVSRTILIASTKECGWNVTHQRKPKVHPDRKMSEFYYRFAVTDVVDRRRALHLEVALKRV